MSSSVCRICLVGNVKMYFIQNKNLLQTYEKLATAELNTVRGPRGVCYLCYSQLRKCCMLSEMSQGSNHIIKVLLSCDIEVTQEAVAKLNVAVKPKMICLSVTPLQLMAIKTPAIHIKDESPDLKLESTDNESSTVQQNIEPTIDVSVNKLPQTPPRNNTITEYVIDKDHNDECCLPINPTLVLSVKDEQPNVKQESMEAEDLLFTANNHKELDNYSDRINNLQDSIVDDNQLFREENNIEIDTQTASNNEIQESMVYKDQLFTKDNELANTDTIPESPVTPVIKNCTVFLTRITDNVISLAHHTGHSQGKTFVNKELVPIHKKDKTRQSVNPKMKQGNEVESVKTKRKKNSLCSECGKKFISKAALLLHMRTHTGEKPYSCQQCDKSFSQKGNLTLHMRVHTGERPYSCNLCYKAFSSNCRLVKHMRIHSGDKLYTCKICNKGFVDKCYLATHMHNHDPEIKRETYPCNQCNRRYFKKSNLALHMRTHTGIRPYTCNECGKSYFHKVTLANHIQSHSGEKPYSCEQCEKRFAHKHGLATHMIVHTGEKIYSCKQCLKSFSRKTTLIKHVKSHTGERPYKCTQCVKSFTQNGNLTRHMQCHSSEPRDKPQFICDYCLKSCNSKHHLMGHIHHIHTGVKPYKCKQCNNRFSHRSSLSGHMQVHTEETPHKCTHCAKSFKTTAHLLRHMRIHTGEKPYTCKICDKSFLDRPHLKRHNESKTHIIMTKVHCLIQMRI